MGYSKHVRVINRVQSMLDQMLVAMEEGRDLSWVVTDTERITADKLGYQLREGRYASQFHTHKGTPYTEYAKLEEKFRIRVRGNRVIAEYLEKSVEAQVQATFTEMVFDDLVDGLSIIGAVIKFKGQSMNFPKADTSYENLKIIYNWANTHEYFVYVINGVTVSKEKRVNEWSPTQEIADG